MKIKPLSNADRKLLLRFGLDSADFPNAVHVTYSKGEFISRENEPLIYLYFVVSGKAKVLLSLSDGKQLMLAYFISKGIIGDMQLMTGADVNHTVVQAVTRVECLGIPLREHRTTLTGNIIFMNHIGRELSEKLMQRGVNGAITTLQPLESRLCAYIFQTASDGVFNEKLTEVAEMVGASYRHLHRCLNKLCDAGILQKEMLQKGKKGYRIKNEQTLRSMTNDLYVLR